MTRIREEEEEVVCTMEVGAAADVFMMWFEGQCNL